MRFSALLAGVAALFVAAGPVWVSRAFADDADTCSRESGDVAIAACTRVIQDSGTSTSGLEDAYVNRGAEYNAKGDNDRAIADYNTALRLDPKDSKAFNDRGNAYSDKGQYDRAIQDYDQAIRLDPRYAHAFNNRGVAFYDKGQYDRAIQDYDQAIRFDSQYAGAFKNRGNAKLKKGDTVGGNADIAKARQLDPSIK